MTKAVLFFIGVLLLQTNCENILTNSDFELPILPSPHNWLQITDMPSWTVTDTIIPFQNFFMLAQAQIYGPNWRNPLSQVVELDPVHNSFYNQTLSTLTAGATYVLSFQWVARSGLPLTTSYGKVYWNGNLQKALTPTDYGVHTEEIFVQAISGTNTVSFLGAGTDDGGGMTIDNVDLRLQQNMILNGGFEIPALPVGNAVIIGSISNWVASPSSVEVGLASIYSPNWAYGYSQVIELDVSVNTAFTQIFSTLTANTQYVLSFQWAARYGQPLQTSQATIIWNGANAQSVIPVNYNQNSTVVILTTALSGPNNLTLQGSGTSDGLGLTVDNIDLRLASSTNVVNNSNFSVPILPPGLTWESSQNIPGWNCTGTVQVGLARVYNPSWTNPNIQVIELDSNANVIYSQTFTTLTPSANYILSFNWAARIGQPLSTSNGSVTWNSGTPTILNPTDYTINSVTLTLTAAATGNNILSFAGLGASDSYGISIGNISLIQVVNPKPTNLFKDGNFDAQISPWYCALAPITGCGVNIASASSYCPAMTGKAAISTGTQLASPYIYISQDIILPNPGSYNVTFDFSTNNNDPNLNLIIDAGIEIMNNPFVATPTLKTTPGLVQSVTTQISASTSVATVTIGIQPRSLSATIVYCINNLVLLPA